MDNFEQVSKLEEDLELPKGFLNDTFKEGDWSLIIKLNALFETALTQSINALLDQPKISDFVVKLNLNGRTGKLKLAQSLNVLDLPQCDFIKELSAIRNMAAHNIKNVNLDLKKYFRSIKKEQIDAFLSGIGFDRKTQIGNDNAKDLLIQNPHLFLYIGSVIILAQIFGHKQKAKMIKDLTAYFSERGYLKT